jgi:AraC-like DNA-binding protein
MGPWDNTYPKHIAANGLSPWPDTMVALYEESRFMQIEASSTAFQASRLPFAHMVALAVACSHDASLNIDSVRIPVMPGSIIAWSQPSGRELLTWNGWSSLYVLAIGRRRLSRVGLGWLSPPLCTFGPGTNFRDDDIAQCMSELSKLVNPCSCAGKFYREAYTSQIALRALKRCGRLPLRSSNYKDPLKALDLKLVLEYIYTHARDSTLRSGTVAQLISLPVDVFRHRFQKSVQRSFHQAVLDVRLEFGMQELLHTARPISEIAVELGFADHSHFNKLFRRRIGISPSCFRDARQSHRGGVLESCSRS